MRKFRSRLRVYFKVVIYKTGKNKQIHLMLDHIVGDRNVLYFRGIVRSMYRDNVSNFDVEAGQVIVVAVILQRSHLHCS